MSFDEVRLPEDIERGARGGPSFNTTVAAIDSGFEKRNINWTRERNNWNLGYGIQDKAGYTRITNFFRLRRGRAYGFRFKDWSDFEIMAGNIGTGNNSDTEFQIRKQYTDALRTYNRPIQKIVAGSYTVFVNSVEQTEVTNYSIDLNTGVVTFTSAPGNGLPITITCEFDIPVRFDTDEMDLDIQLIEAGQVPNIPIVELPLALAVLNE